MMAHQHPALKTIVEHTYDPLQQKLTLSGIANLPRQIFDIAEDVKILDISHNRISTLPNDFNRLHNLEVFFASYTDFPEMPHQLAGCQSLMTIGMQACNLSGVPDGTLPQSLQALILTNNKLTRLPGSIGELPELRKLTLTGNHIQKLPESLLCCKKLEFIRLAANQMSEEPVWLLSQLSSLAWYADSHNLFSPNTSAALRSRPTIEWQDIEIIKSISKNYKNEIFSARLKSNGNKVAVKVFGTATSADGYAEDEIANSIALGLLDTVRVLNTPDGNPCMAMTLLNDDVNVLGLPPTLWTITRDTYLKSQKFTANFVLWLLQNAASQLAAMHAKHIMHGDIYAHNILTDRITCGYLTDFGASSLYRTKSAPYRERIEVNAFGKLIHELSSRCTGPPDELNDLQQACVQADILSRPRFVDIFKLIQSLSG